MSSSTGRVLAAITASALPLALFCGFFATNQAQAAAPTEWGPAVADDGTQTLKNKQTASIQVVAGGTIGDYMPVQVRVPTSGQGITTKKWTFYATDKNTNNGNPFLLASGQTTFKFKLIQAGYRIVHPGKWRNISQYEFDDFYNICLDGDHETWASGGVIYCRDWIPGSVEQEPRIVRVSTKTSGIRNFPRPIRLSKTTYTEIVDFRGNRSPSCTPGTTRIEEKATTNEVYTCVVDDESGQSITTTTTRVWTRSGWTEVVDRSVAFQSQVPEWSPPRSDALPKPTASFGASEPIVTSWTVKGTLTNPNPGSCLSVVTFQRPDGTWTQVQTTNGAGASLGWTRSVPASSSASFIASNLTFNPAAVEGRWFPGQTTPCSATSPNPPYLAAAITEITPNHTELRTTLTITSQYRSSCHGEIWFFSGGTYLESRSVDFPPGVSTHSITVLDRTGPPLSAPGIRCDTPY